MQADTKKLQKQLTASVGSKVRFQWKFKDELEKTLEMVAGELEKSFPDTWTLSDLTLWNNNIKLKITENMSGHDMMINCIFRYSRDDEKFGNIHIELAVSEISQKTKVHFMWKYNVIDHKNIIKNIVRDFWICLTRGMK